MNARTCSHSEYSRDRRDKIELKGPSVAKIFTLVRIFYATSGSKFASGIGPSNMMNARTCSHSSILGTIFASDIGPSNMMNARTCSHSSILGTIFASQKLEEI